MAKRSRSQAVQSGSSEPGRRKSSVPDGHPAQAAALQAAGAERLERQHPQHQGERTARLAISTTSKIHEPDVLIINKKQNTTAIASYSNCLVEKLHPDHRNNEAPRRTADNTLTSLGCREARDSTPEGTRKETEPIQGSSSS
jgi:hypothetical protein